MSASNQPQICIFFLCKSMSWVVTFSDIPILIISIFQNKVLRLDHHGLALVTCQGLLTLSLCLFSSCHSNVNLSFDNIVKYPRRQTHVVISYRVCNPLPGSDLISGADLFLINHIHTFFKVYLLCHRFNTDFYDFICWK